MTFARPETRYAEADGVRIAYQVYGDGKRTLIGVPGFAQNMDVIWENPEATAFFERLGSVCRVIHFDKRGTGLSDRSLPPPSLDARVQDLVAVMRAENVDRAAVAGFSEGDIGSRRKKENLAKPARRAWEVRFIRQVPIKC